MGPGPEVRHGSPVTPGAFVARDPLYCSSCAPCRLDRQNDLTHEDPGANTHVHTQKERERAAGHEWELGILLLQLYYNGNSAFLRNPLPYL